MIPVAFVSDAFRRFQTPPASDFSQVMDFSINAHLKILFGVLRWGCILRYILCTVILEVKGKPVAKECVFAFFCGGGHLLVF